MSFNFWYWLSAVPSLEAPVRRWWGVAASLAIILAIVVATFTIKRIRPAFRQRPWTRVARLLAANGIVLGILLFFRDEGIPFFGARFWLLLLLVGDVAWLAVIVQHFVLKLPRERRAWEAEQQKRKYLK